MNKHRISLLIVVVLVLGIIPAIAPAAAAGTGFSDVVAGSFYEEPVEWAVANGITKGTTATTFNPNGACLRSHVVTFLWRAAGKPEPKSTTNPFVDVKTSDFFYKPVLWALEKNITKGVDDTHFGPDQTCNRGQVVTFLWRATGKPEPTSSKNPFVDVKSSDFFYKPVLWAREKNVTKGVDDTHFGPDQSCNRAQVVTFLYRCFANKDKPLTIITQPVDAVARVGERVSFKVAVIGGKPPYSYQWQLIGNDLTDWTNFNYSSTAYGMKAAELSTETSIYDFARELQYRCVITDADGNTVISNAVKIAEPPNTLAISCQPKSACCETGDTVSFTVEVTGGTPPYKYQWQYSYKATKAWYDAENGPYTTGVKTETLHENVTEDAKEIDFCFRCVITDADGNTRISNAAYLLDPFTIQSQPKTQTGSKGDTLSYTVSVTGGRKPYSYQWYLKAQSGQWIKSTVNSSTYKFEVNANTVLQAYAFYCVITDDAGNIVTTDTVFFKPE